MGIKLDVSGVLHSIDHRVAEQIMDVIDRQKKATDRQKLHAFALQFLSRSVKELSEVLATQESVDDILDPEGAAAHETEHADFYDEVIAAATEPNRSQHGFVPLTAMHRDVAVCLPGDYGLR